MRKLIGLLCLVLVLSACDFGANPIPNVPAMPTKSNFLVTAIACQDIDIGMGGVGGMGSSPEFKVVTNIANNSGRPQTVTGIKAVFMSTKTSGLTLNTTIHEGKGAPIAADGAIPLDLNTDGYTYQLLSEADGKALSLLIEVSYIDGTATKTDGVFMAILPDLKDLPMFDYTKNPKGTALTFAYIPTMKLN